MRKERGRKKRKEKEKKEQMERERSLPSCEGREECG